MLHPTPERRPCPKDFFIPPSPVVLRFHHHVMAAGNRTHQNPANGSALKFEARLWVATDQAVPAPDYRKTKYDGSHLAGLFQKSISDAFEEEREQLLCGFSNPESKLSITEAPAPGCRRQTRAGPRMSAPSPIPTGLNHLARGCPVGGTTLGNVVPYFPQPQRGCINGVSADFIQANPPFNLSEWGGENLRQHLRWKFGTSPVNTTNDVWIQH